MLDAIKVKGREIALLGKILQTGQKAPDFKLTNTHMNDVSLSHYKGHIIILATMPSLDTETCSLEAKHFNTQASLLSSKIKIIVVSKDLPFTQEKWCLAKNAEDLITLSAYKNNNFAKDYGVLLARLELLARAVFIIDGEGVLRYIQYVKNIEEEPDYNSVLTVAKELVKGDKK
jgi:thiol peroxidase